MPLYDYACETCGAHTEAHRTVKNRRRGPKHCGKSMTLQVTASYHVWGAFAPYRAVAGDRRQINTRQEHKDFLRQHGYEEVGNDRSMAPPDMHATEREWQQQKEPERREIERSFREVEAIRRHLGGN